MGDGVDGLVLEELGMLLRDMRAAKKGVISPTMFREQIGKANTKYASPEKQDAHVFVNYLFDCLSDAGNRVHKKPFVDRLEDGWIAKHPLRLVGDESWRR